MTATFDAARRFVGAANPTQSRDAARDFITPNPKAKQPVRKPPVKKPPPATPGPPAPAAPTAAATTAKTILIDFLKRFGLESLAEWAWSTYTSAGDPDLGMQLVEARLPDQEAYKVRFPAIGDRQKKGLAPITPADYISYETTLRQAFSAHGLPLPTTGASFDSMVSQLLGNDVSAAEVVNQRIGSAFDRVATAPIEVRQAAARLWGVQGDAALAAFFLDPGRSAPELERLSKSFEVAGTAQRFGLDIGAERAGRLADLGANANLDRFAQIGQLDPLFRENVGENTDLSAANEGVAAAFGENATSAAMIAQRLARRKAELGGGGSFYESGGGGGGISGLGSGPS